MSTENSKKAFGKSEGASKKIFFRRTKTCPFKGNPDLIDYKDAKLLSRYVSESGKMTPSRITAVSTKCQRALSLAVKRARFLALMPYVSDKK